MSFIQSLGSESSSQGSTIYEGGDLSDRKITSITGDFIKGKNCGYLRWGVKENRLQPEEIIKNIRKEDLKEVDFLFLLGYLIRNGLDLNFYFTGYVNIHLAVFIYTKYPENPLKKYIEDILKTAGCNFGTLAYTGNNVDSKTVSDVLGKERIQEDEEIDMVNFVFSKGIKEYKLRWKDVKSIILDKKKERFDMFSSENVSLNYLIGFQMMVISNSVNLLESLDDNELFLNQYSAMEQSILLSIIYQNYEVFELSIDKGCEVSYPAMVELISRYNLAGRDKLLKNIYGNMISYAVKTGSYIDTSLYQMLSMEANVEMLDNLREDFSKPVWKKLCRNKVGNQKNNNKKLRQLAFNLNLDYGLTPEEICEKLEMISNEDRVKYVEETILRQEKRIEKEIIERGLVNREDPLDRLRCDPKTQILKNPYAYGDGHVSFYVDKNDQKLWCFTSDLFDTLIRTKKNPYNNQELPSSFLETIKTKNHVLEFLHLKRGSKVTTESVNETLKNVFDTKNEISNEKSDKEYNIFINHLAVLNNLSEIDIREKLKPSSEGKKRLALFVNLSFIYPSNYEMEIVGDNGFFSQKDNSYTNPGILKEYLDGVNSRLLPSTLQGGSSGAIAPRDIKNAEGKDTGEKLHFISSNLKILTILRRLQYREYLSSGYFSEINYKLYAYLINDFINRFTKSKFYYGDDEFYRFGSSGKITDILKKNFTSDRI